MVFYRKLLPLTQKSSTSRRNKNEGRSLSGFIEERKTKRDGKRTPGLTFHKRCCDRITGRATFSAGNGSTHTKDGRGRRARHTHPALVVLYSTFRIGLHGSGFFPSLGCFPEEVERQRTRFRLMWNSNASTCHHRRRCHQDLMELL